MPVNKEIAVQVDVEALKKIRSVRPPQPTNNVLQPQSTVFALGLDPRVSTKPQMSVPSFTLVEFLKDRLGNPYTNLHWQVPRADVASVGVVGFNVYRVFSGSLTSSFSNVAYDKLGNKNIKIGYFSGGPGQGKNFIRPSLIPPSLFNFNLQTQIVNQNTNNFGTLMSQSVPLQNYIPTTISDQKLAYVDYARFTSLQAQQTIDSIDQNIVEMTYADKSVKYGDIWNYYVTSVTSDGQESTNSEEITITIFDTVPVDPPSTLIAKQVDETHLQIRAKFRSDDNIEGALVFRKSEDEISFSQIANVSTVNDCVNLVDGTVQYNKSYTYRVFSRNIFGTLSSPSEIVCISSVQNLTNRTKSNNLKSPILTAIQDQNSNYINIIMASNDPLISFYILDRRDLTIHEKLFTVPSQNYGGNIFGSTYYGPTFGTSYGTGNSGWVTNKFFVDNTKNPVGAIIEQNLNVFNKITTGKELIFQDTTVQPGHIYEYRVCGSDLFGNLSSYAFAQVTATGKKTLRTPINLSSSILREEPLRVLITWTDDNLATTFSASQLADNTATDTNPYLYQVQRRQFSDHIYESFPLTVNSFVVDEVAANDSVPLTPQLADKNAIISSSSLSSSVNNSLSRPFNVPNYLLTNKYYYYRIQASTVDGQQSNFTDELEVSTFPDLSDPINFAAIVQNTKIRPLICHLTWGVEDQKVQGDFYTIERKFDTPNDTYELMGKSYLNLEFFDYTIQDGNSYVYRIQAIDTLNRMSNYSEVRLTI